MQIMINVPDNLPMTRAIQRIKELEQSLRDEARMKFCMHCKTHPCDLDSGTNLSGTDLHVPAGRQAG